MGTWAILRDNLTCTQVWHVFPILFPCFLVSTFQIPISESPSPGHWEHFGWDGPESAEFMARLEWGLRTACRTDEEKVRRRFPSLETFFGGEEPTPSGVGCPGSRRPDTSWRTDRRSSESNCRCFSEKNMKGGRNSEFSLETTAPTHRKLIFSLLFFFGGNWWHFPRRLLTARRILKERKSSPRPSVIRSRTFSTGETFFCLFDELVFLRRRRRCLFSEGNSRERRKGIVFCWWL